ncbi:amidohydrolase [Planctomonas psychrotolerans]|uniref:amidohydrolase n=1 Tax=Planctomonas psychrotolerans TaxID=2528712 RepID=UPI001D0D501E|nr:amidohydrolase family protein [Planctomonas psychrotolerans]
MTPRPALLLRDARLAEGAEPVDLFIEDGVLTRAAPSGAGAPGSADGSTGVEVRHLDGRHVVPGLWDNHVHFTQWTLTRRRLTLESATSAAEVARLVGERVASRVDPDGMPVVGYGFRDALWPDVPTAALLDSVAESVPVVLVSGDVHSCWLNTAALRVFGYPSGEGASGLLREEDSFEIVRRLQEVAAPTVDRWAAEAATEAASRGVVGVVDMEMRWNLDDWVRRIGGGTVDLRVEFGTYRAELDRAIGMGLRSGQVVDGTDGLLTVGPFKVITDGSLNTRTAFCFDEYPGMGGSPDPKGLLTVPPDELVEAMSRATAGGLRCAVHAIGDHANRLALDAFEATGATGSVEHAQLLTEEDIPRFAALGVAASMQPDHALDDRDVADAYWTGRTHLAFPVASLLRSGARVVLGSDAPVSPLDPWITMAAAVWRTRHGLPAWHGEQAIDVAAALAASSRHAVTVGAPADLVVLDADPYTASIETFRSMPVAATLLGGRFTHDSL